MKKKLATTLSVVLILGLAVLGILAYLTSEDSDVNVMTLGNVDIEQNEYEWNEDGTELVDFTQAKPLYPYVGTQGWKNTDYADGAYRQFTMNNALDKYVTVENNGKSDAYVRTVFAFEMGELTAKEWDTYLGLAINAEVGATYSFTGSWTWEGLGLGTIVEIDGHNYMIYVGTHKDPLAAGEETVPSLLQVYMTNTATNEIVEKVDGNNNGTYDILVLSQAVQAEGFADAQTALDTAFGDVTKANVQAWFSGDEFKIPKNAVQVSNAAELQAVLKELNNGYNKETGETKEAYIVLKDDIELDASAEFMFNDSNGGSFYLNHANVTLDLNGKTIKAKSNALMDGKETATGLFIVRYSTLNIIGEGNIITENEAIPVYGWAHSKINIYGGNFISNASERNESAVYVNYDTVTINVYGGTFTENDYTFNAHDNYANGPVIVLHEGVTFKKFLKNGTTDVIANDINKGRIVCADGCEFEKFEDGGVTMYKVVKK